MLGFLGIEATRENGLKFDSLLKCQRCGKCCNAELFKDGVLIFPFEVERLAMKAGLSKHQFKDRHTDTLNGKRFMKLPCVFYDKGCLVHYYRPIVCREFPLNQLVKHNGHMEMTVNMDCPAGKVLGEKYAVKVQV